MRQSGKAVVSNLAISAAARAGHSAAGMALPRFRLPETGADVVKNRHCQETWWKPAISAPRKRDLIRRSFQKNACNPENVADHSFDLVVSIFSAMYAHALRRRQREMVRVANQGGRIVMGN